MTDRELADRFTVEGDDTLRTMEQHIWVMQKEPKYFARIPQEHHFPALAELAIELDPENYFSLRADLRTVELTLTASTHADRTAWLIDFAPQHILTPEVCEELVTRSPATYRHIPKDKITDELRLIALKANPRLYLSMPEVMEYFDAQFDLPVHEVLIAEAVNRFNKLRDFTLAERNYLKLQNEIALNGSIRATNSVEGGLRVVFLDFDGVIKHPTLHDEWYRDSVALIKFLCIKTNAKIVVASTWKLVKGHDFFRRIFGELYIGVTPHGGRAFCPKEIEVTRYLAAHDVAHWIAIDDKADEYPKTSDRLVHTVEGKFTVEHCKTALKLLREGKGLSIHDQ